MIAPRLCSSISGLFLALFLTACGGGGGGSSTPQDPPLTDSGGFWVGTWIGTQGAGAGHKGNVIVEMHQNQADLDGYVTATDQYTSTLLNQSMTGKINGASIQFGVAGLVTYTGTLSATSAWGDFVDTGNVTSGTWKITRLMAPFDGNTTPTYDLSGTWDTTPVSTTGPSPASGMMTIYQSGQSLSGSMSQSGHFYPLLAARVSGNVAWYVIQPDADTVITGSGTASDATHVTGSYVQYDVSVSTSATDRGTWTAVKQP